VANRSSLRRERLSKHHEGQLDALENRVRARLAAKRTRAFMGAYLAAMPGAMGTHRDRMRTRRQLTAILKGGRDA
jgi:hypothetical protein